MISVGIDIGSITAKAAILDEGQLKGTFFQGTGYDARKAAEAVMQKVLAISGYDKSNVDIVVATGYGRKSVSFADKTITEISCHAKGANWIFPTVHTVLDMGGQDCKVITCDDAGKVTSFVMNDKCAAGAGRSMEIVAKLIGIPLESIGDISLQSIDEPAEITSTCVLFARSEIMELMRDGVPKSNILAGTCDALTSRVLTLLSRAQVQKDLAITGGIAKNIGVTKRVEDRLGLKAKIYEEPQIIGALGAAIFAKETLMKTGKKREAVNV